MPEVVFSAAEAAVLAEAFDFGQRVPSTHVTATSASPPSPSPPPPADQSGQAVQASVGAEDESIDVANGSMEAESPATSTGSSGAVAVLASDEQELFRPSGAAGAAESGEMNGVLVDFGDGNLIDLVLGNDTLAAAVPFVAVLAAGGLLYALKLRGGTRGGGKYARASAHEGDGLRGRKGRKGRRLEQVEAGEGESDEEDEQDEAMRQVLTKAGGGLD